MEIVETGTFKHHNTVVIDRDDGVWLTFSAEWWMLSAWVVWWLQPGKVAWLQLKVCSDDGPNTGSIEVVRVRAKRISRAYVRMG
jgi:hypothetical protein